MKRHNISPHILISSPVRYKSVMGDDTEL